MIITTTAETTTTALGPSSLGSYVGQVAMKELLVAHVDAALDEQRRLPHLLLIGPPGSGKTTIAHIVASMMRQPIHVLSAAPDVRSFIFALEEMGGAGILFVDEVHLLSRSTQDKLLLTLLEEQFIDCQYGRFEYPNLTVIAATTERNKVREPVRERFTLQPRWEDYTEPQLARIASDMAMRAELDCEWEVCEAFGRASAGVPRQVRHLVTHAKALERSRGTWTIDDVLTMANVCHDGLTYDHIDYLTRLKEMGGLEVGLETLAERLRFPTSTVRNIERLLLDRGLIALRRTGRQLTTAGRARLTEAQA